MMKRVSVSVLLTLFSLFCTSMITSAQDLTGIWKGYFLTDAGDYYKLEFQVDQNKTLGVTGVSYSYLDVRFYGKATMTGSFVRNSLKFRVREIKTVEVKSSTGQGTCIMNYDLEYKKSGKEEFLEGKFLGKTEVKAGPNPYAWGQCGGGRVFLRRVTTSDFYVEPFLRGKIKKQDPSPAPLVNKAPVRKDTTVKKNNVVKTTPRTNTPPKTVIVNQPPVRKPATTQQKNPPPLVKADTVRKTTINPVMTPDPVKVKVNVPVPDVLTTRTNELVKTLVLKNPEVVIKIYDNGEIDDDTISVYLDNKLVLSKKRLTASPLLLKFNMDEDNKSHELVMVAENLGRIPPNTSLMIVESGEQRFEVRITSTEQKNALVRFKYELPK